jgi:pimeloyl-ACP methyl ester carboxylesterase
MSSQAAPLLVIVPGAFGTPDGFDKLKPHLGGLQTRPGPNLSCQPEDAKAVTCRGDIAALRDNVLLPLLEGGNDVVIIAHSYGGIVAGGAAKGLDRDARKAQGHDTAVLGLVYVAGNISLENESLLQSIGGELPAFVKVDKPAEGLSLIEPAMEILYNDCDPSLEAELNETVKPHALRAFDTEPSAPAVSYS